MYALTMLYREHREGFSHLVAGVAIQISPAAFSGNINDLKHYVQEAWIALRHRIPLIACKTIDLSGHEEFAFQYTVPTGIKDLEEWANETLVFADSREGEEGTLLEKHTELRDGRWWRSSEGRYNAEMHISRLRDNEWHVG